MSNGMNMQEVIAQCVSDVAEVLKNNGIPNDFGMEALRWLENYIDRERDTFSEKEKERVTIVVGAYLGECLCRANNGHWVVHERGWGVDMDSATLVGFPFAKVGKWVASGETGDSFVSMFRCTPALLEHVKSSKKDAQ